MIYGITITDNVVIVLLPGYGGLLISMAQVISVVALSIRTVRAFLP